MQNLPAVIQGQNTLPAKLLLLLLLTFQFWCFNLWPIKAPSLCSLLSHFLNTHTHHNWSIEICTDPVLPHYLCPHNTTNSFFIGLLATYSLKVFPILDNAQLIRTSLKPRPRPLPTDLVPGRWAVRKGGAASEEGRALGSVSVMLQRLSGVRWSTLSCPSPSSGGPSQCGETGPGCADGPSPCRPLPARTAGVGTCSGSLPPPRRGWWRPQTQWRLAGWSGGGTLGVSSLALSTNHYSANHQSLNLMFKTWVANSSTGELLSLWFSLLFSAN